MRKVISTEKILIKMWLDEPEAGAMKQALQSDLVKIKVELSPLAVVKG